MAKNEKAGKKITAGVLAAGAAAVAGYYFYKSKDAKKHRDAAAAWARDFKKEVEKGVKKFPAIERAAVAAAVDTATAAYKRRGKYRAEIAHVAKELKTNWERLKKEISSKTKKRKR
jgi:hypothetical protein